MADQKVISIVLWVLIIVIVFLSPISLSNMAKCFCGGCCKGCPGDCNSIGAPFAIYYWGVNNISGETVNEFSIPGFIIDLVVVGFLAFLVYKKVYKK